MTDEPQAQQEEAVDTPEQKAEREQKAAEALALEGAEAEAARHGNKAKVVTRFAVDNATVEGVDEERWPDDFPIEQLRGQIKTPASVKIGFDQHFNVNHLMQLPGQDAAVSATTRLLTTTHIAEGLNPDLAVQMGEFLMAEGKRVKATMQEQPLDTSAFSGLVATSDAEVKAAAEARKQIEGLANGQPPTT